MDRVQQLKKNPRWLAFAKLGLELKALNAVVTLFHIHRGVGVDQIFYLSVAWSVATLLFEIPTGYLADRVGRKRTLLLGAFITLLSSIFAFWAQGMWAFCIQVALMSFGFSCFSGTEEALLYDTLQETGQESHMNHYKARLSAANNGMKIFVPALGAWIAKDLLESQFQILVLINAVGAFIAFLFLFQLREPKHVKAVLKEEEGIFRQSLRTIRSEPFLLRAALNKILVFICGFLIWKIYAPYFLQYGVPALWIGFFYVGFKLSETVLTFFLEKLEKLFTPVRLVAYTTVLLVLGLLGMIFLTKSPVLLVVSAGIAIVMASIREPMFSHAMNRRIQSRSRATTLSNLYVLKALLDIPLFFLSGALVLQDSRYVFALCVILCLVVLFFFPIRQKDLESVAGDPSPAAL